MEGKSPWRKLRELGVRVPKAFAVLPAILLDRISTDWVLGPGNDLLTHYRRTICLGLISVLGIVGGGQPSAYRVVIDAGHGGDDTGGIGLYGLIEKNTVLQIAHLMAIEAASVPEIKIILTRTDDRYLSPEERAQAARGADLFISLHTDFSYDPRVRGITALVPTRAGTPA